MNIILILLSLICFVLFLIYKKKKENFESKKRINIVLMTQFYIPKNEERKREIIICLEKNIKNKYIEKIYLFCEKDYNLNEYIDSNINLDKVELININKRLSYKDAFEYSNRHIVNDNLDNIIILANSDIYFDNTLNELYNYDLKNKFLALSRIDSINKDGSYNYQKKWSQDTWIWKNKINITHKIDDYNNDGILLGIGGCDNSIVYMMKKCNYIVENKCKLINTYHLHKNDFREWHNKQKYTKNKLDIECT